MADRVFVTIRIGGSLSRAHVPALVAVIEREGATTDWEGTPFSTDELHGQQPLELVAYEVAWGNFEELEHFCLTHGLPFIRWSGGCPGSFGPERVVFDGQNDPCAFLTTEDDDILISLEDVRRLATIGAIEAHFAGAERQVQPLTIVDDLSGDGGTNG